MGSQARGASRRAWGRAATGRAVRARALPPRSGSLLLHQQGGASAESTRGIRRLGVGPAARPVADAGGNPRGRGADAAVGQRSYEDPPARVLDEGAGSLLHLGTRDPDASLA